MHVLLIAAMFVIICVASRKLPYSGNVSQGKVWQINKSANRLLIVSTNLDGFSLVNQGQFSKFAKLSPYKPSHHTV